MTRLDAVQFLINEGHRGSEWQEAGLFSAVCLIMSPTNDDQFDGTPDIDAAREAWLLSLVERAQDY